MIIDLRARLMWLNSKIFNTTDPAPKISLSGSFWLISQHFHSCNISSSLSWLPPPRWTWQALGRPVDLFFRSKLRFQSSAEIFFAWRPFELFLLDFWNHLSERFVKGDSFGSAIIHHNAGLVCVWVLVGKSSSTSQKDVRDGRKSMQS